MQTFAGISPTRSPAAMAHAQTLHHGVGADELPDRVFGALPPSTPSIEILALWEAAESERPRFAPPTVSST